MTPPPEQSEALLSLADRVERGEGDVRELECRVWVVTTGGPSFEVCAAVVPDLLQWQAPAYLRSLDAAMMLVPEGWKRIMGDEPDTGLVMAGLYKDGQEDAKSIAATIPMALTAAALRSLALQTGGE